MGLDMYMFSADADKVQIDEVKIVSPIGEVQASHVATWRKHYPLHRWMENLYVERGGSEEFNQTDILLTKDNLEDLRVAVLKDAFKTREDVSIDYLNFQKTQDLKFIEDALAEIERGKVVFYTSWW